MTDEKVLVRPQRQRGRCIYHLQDDDGNPVCGTELRNPEYEFKERKRTLLSDSWRLCTLCDPDHDIERSHPGKHLATRLREADPDDIGGAST